MAMIRWFGENDLFSEFSRLNRDLERVVTGFSGASRRGGIFGRTGVYPPINLYDDGENIIARAEVPGIDPKDIEVTVTQDTLTIRGERKNGEVEGNAYHRRERDRGVFHRSLTLSEPVDSSKVVAAYRDGILEIRMPRAEEAKPRRIAIN